MAECRDFFDDSSAGPSRSNALSNDTSPSDLSRGKKDEGLELTLGPSNFSGTSVSPPRQQPDMVRAAPAYSFLQRQPSGNLASCMSATAHTSHTPLLQTDGPNLASRQHDVAASLSRQQSGNFACAGEHPPPTYGSQADATLPVKALLPEGNSTFPSRDQIWQNLQRSSTLFEHPQHSNDASAMLSRRAASMQVVFPRNGVDDSEHFQIRRSCSNGLLAHAIPRQLSNIESSMDRSPQRNMVFSSHPHQEELEDLQKRKELQAQRRLVARKRRKNIIEEKQNKKGRQSSGLLRTGSRHSISPSEKSSKGEDDAAPADNNCMSSDDVKSGRSDDVKKGIQELKQGSKHDMRASSNEDAERLSQDMQLDGGSPNHPNETCSGSAEEQTQNFVPNEHDSGNHGSLTSCELEQSAGLISKCSVASNLLSSTSNEHENGKPHAVTMMNDHAGMPASEAEGAKHSPSSETDCAVKSGISMDASKEGGEMRRMMSSSFSNGSTGCPPLLFSSMQFADAAVASEPVFPFSYIMRNPPVGNCQKGSSMQTLPTVHGACPPVTSTSVGTFPLPSGAFLSQTTSATKDFIGDSEGKGGRNERSAFSFLPRTTSNSKHISEEPHYSGAHPDFQACLPASQLSSTSTIMSDASNGKNLLLERQPSRPLGGRLLSQNSCIVDQAVVCLRQEKILLSQSRVSVPFETPNLRLGKSNFKQEEGMKQEEGSSESQLASEHSCVDASYAQSAAIERQRSGSFSDLPWVTTTGKGPNGKTINGVMYIAEGRHVRLVCSCHGKHMSPVEFVEHSGSSDLSYPERKIVVSPSPHLNYQVTSTPV